MAIYHFSGSIISRSKGLSSVSIAGSYSCEKLYDARLGLTITIINDHNVIFKKVLLPQNAPEWMSDREKLWNAVEKKEYRMISLGKDDEGVERFTVDLGGE
ncbi:hypothetical protein GAMM_350012 [Gammaproteobacteria bacterium]